MTADSAAALRIAALGKHLKAAIDRIGSTDHPLPSTAQLDLALYEIRAAQGQLHELDKLLRSPGGAS